LLSSRSEAEGSASSEPPQPPTKPEQDLFASDVLRYFLLREIPFGQDGTFSFDALITRYNADLANGYGNLVSRTLGLIQQNFADGLTKPSAPWLCQDRDCWRGDNAPTKEFEARSGTHFIISETTNFAELCNEQWWPTYRFQILLAELALKISHVDAYLSFHKPWLLAKAPDDESKRKLIEVLYTAVEAIRILTAILYPVAPFATASVWRQLGLGDIEEAARNGELKDLKWGGLKPGTKLGPLSPIFPRADKGLAQIMIDMESPASATPEATPTSPAPETDQSVSSVTSVLSPSPDAPAEPAKPESPTITIDDFAKVDLRVAQILVAERIPKADKLLRLEVDLGYEKRQILAGIAEYYQPEALIGRKVVIVANLAPRKMRGLISQGMVVAASLEDHGRPALASFIEEIELGARLH
jgi:methionyl-tRNA synthetase